jgi:hypothetical protein
MKRWIRWAALLYPFEWRVRYGAEFDALLDDAGLRWGDLVDVIKGAARMQMTSFNSYWKVAGLAAIAGGILAVGISLAISNRDSCRATVTVFGDIGENAALSQSEVVQEFERLRTEELSKDNLVRLITDQDLYRNERLHVPIADVAEVFQRNVRIQEVEQRGLQQVFAIRFEYPDPGKAQEVVNRMVSDLMWKTVIKRHSSGYPRGIGFRILESAATLNGPIYPNRAAIPMLGAITGMIMGAISLLAWRRTVRHAALNISLPKDIGAILASQVAAGSYRNADDYIRELIRADGERQK